MHPHAARYNIERGVLRPLVALDSAFAAEFEQACKELLESRERELVIDLTSHSYLTSVYLGIVGAIAAQAAERGKRLSVRASARIARFFDAVSLGKLVRIEPSPS